MVENDWFSSMMRKTWSEWGMVELDEVGCEPLVEGVPEVVDPEVDDPEVEPEEDEPDEEADWEADEEELSAAILV